MNLYLVTFKNGKERLICDPSLVIAIINNISNEDRLEIQKIENVTGMSGVKKMKQNEKEGVF